MDSGFGVDVMSSKLVLFHKYMLKKLKIYGTKSRAYSTYISSLTLLFSYCAEQVMCNVHFLKNKFQCINDAFFYLFV